MLAPFVYECAACDARFSMLVPEPPPETQRCISCSAEGARLLCKAGEQKGDLHRFSSHPRILDGDTKGVRPQPRFKP